jgi:diguanylate cyclase (GGDEF)-like protein
VDIHTLHIEHAFLLGLYTFLTLINTWLHRGIRGVHLFPIYNLCAFIGALLIAIRIYIPDAIAVVVGTLFFHLAYLALYLCLVDFFGKRSARWQVQAVLTGIGLVALLQFAVFHPSTRNRVVAFSLVFTVQIALCAYLVFRETRVDLRVSGTLMGIVLALLSVNNLLRAIGTLVYGAPSNYLAGGPILQWSLVMTSVLQGGVTVAFVWMTAALLRQQLHVLATTDSLTGLLNRRAIELAAEQKIAQCRQSNRPLSAILLDLDNFKGINDTLGHQQGDATLVAVARCLQREMRQSDVVARFGGDEFLILLGDTPQHLAVEIAERVRRGLEGVCLCDQAQTRVSASLGLSQLKDSQDWDHLITECDKALYAVKSMGGNQVLTC